MSYKQLHTFVCGFNLIVEATHILLAMHISMPYVVLTFQKGSRVHSVKTLQNDQKNSASSHKYKKETL